ncbi:hypothetical protein GLOIN_2v1769951 [Rhizophagus clarus]|uniref:TLDc domain-containing protein n=1 Tax=Rhizophagus clarus TaxID=94130 RepID=A0A8H3LY49_9GLOM|nr:hypothetical protein GLOIN_2v1769951 [Rhizophagus clarus]
MQTKNMSKTWEIFSKNYEKLLLEGYGALSNEWAKQEDGKIVFNKPNMSPPIFDVILKYIYTGSTNVEDQDGEFILSLLTAADELILHELVEEVQHHLVNNRAAWIQENFCHVLDFAFSHTTYNQLQDHCLEAICADPPLLFDSDYFYCIDSAILKSLLKRDDLAIHEGDLWDNLIKWAIIQLTETNVDEVSVDPTKWSKEMMQNFQQILTDCIPLIRFTLMTPDEFREKVWPFKDCLPTKLYDTILWHFIMPEKQSSPFLPRLKTVYSNLITLKHAALIATWIDRKEGKPYSHTEIPYEFSLLMRGSRDGFSQQTLHNRCGGQAKTIMLMKIKATEEIFGMYISSVWSNNTARQHDSFMFSFGEGRETRTPVLSRVRAAGYDLALSRGQERGMDELEMFKITSKTPFSV